MNFKQFLEISFPNAPRIPFGFGKPNSFGRRNTFKNLTFKCANCHRVFDIENSVPIGIELFCPECAGED